MQYNDCNISQVFKLWLFSLCLCTGNYYWMNVYLFCKYTFHYITSSSYTSSTCDHKHWIANITSVTINIMNNHLESWININSIISAHRMFQLTAGCMFINIVFSVIPNKSLFRIVNQQRVPTKDGTSSSTKLVTALTFTVQKVSVGRAGEGPDDTRLIHWAKEQQHGSLVVAFKIRTSCAGDKT